MGLRDRIVRAPSKLPDRGDQVGEPIALNNDVAAEQRLRFSGIAIEDRSHHRLVLGKRSPKPARKTKLQTPIRLQTPTQRAALLKQELIVAAEINGVMEDLIAVVIAVRIGCSHGAPAGFVRLEQAIAILFVRSSRGQSSCHALKLGHHLEHLDDLLCRVGRDNRSAPRPRNDQTGSGELLESFSYRGARNSVACREHELVQPIARPKHTLGDFVFNDVAQPLGGVRGSHGARFSTVERMSQIRLEGGFVR